MRKYTFSVHMDFLQNYAYTTPWSNSQKISNIDVIQTILPGYNAMEIKTND